MFGLLKCRNDKKAMRNYVNEHEEYFRHMDRETALVAGEFLQSEKIIKKMMEKNEKGEEMDMCKALEDLYNDGVSQGISQGLSQGVSQGVENAIKLCKGFGATKEETVVKIADMFEKSEDEIWKEIEKYWNE